MADKMADMAGGQMGWNQLAQGMALRQAVTSTDAVSAVDEAEVGSILNLMNKNRFKQQIDQ